MRILLSLLLVLVSPAAFADVYTDIFDQSDYVVQIKMVKGTAMGHSSGFVFKDEKEEKFVLTAGHMIDSTNDVQLIKSLTAHFRSARKPEKLELVGYDFMMDVALLKFADPKAVQDVTVCKFGSSAQLKIGQEVIHLGLPVPMEKWTFSAGRINNFKTGIEGGFINPQMIIHDALINPGSSGGPLVNLDKEVIGVNVSICFGPNVFSIATPIDDIKRLLPALKKGGEVKHILLPVQNVQNASNHHEAAIKFAYSNNLCDLELTRLGIANRPPKAGVMVVVVKALAAADQAGFKPGDIIVSVDGKAIDPKSDNEKSLADLYRTFYLETDNSKKFKVVVDRFGKPVTLTLELVAPKPPPTIPTPAAPTNANPDPDTPQKIRPK